MSRTAAPKANSTAAEGEGTPVTAAWPPEGARSLLQEKVREVHEATSLWEASE